MNTLGRPASESSPLQVDLPQAMPCDKTPLLPGPHKASAPPSSLHLAVESPSEMANHTSMAAELQELLSQMVLDTSGPASGDSTLRRLRSVTWVVPSTIGVDIPLWLDRPISAMPKLVATSQQVLPPAARPDKTIPISHSTSPSLASETPKVTSVPAIPQPETCPGMDLSSLSDKVLQLQGEMNRAMGHLPTTRASIDAHCRKQVWDFETTFHQNEAQTTKAIKKARAHCVI